MVLFSYQIEEILKKLKKVEKIKKVEKVEILFRDFEKFNFSIEIFGNSIFHHIEKKT